MPKKSEREREERIEHNRVVDSLKAELKDCFAGVPGKRYLVELDSVIEKNHRPDVSVFEKIQGKRVLTEIHEVETEATINPAEAKAQWLPYSKVGVDLYLYVPAHNCDFIRFLCERIGIKVKEFRYFFSVGRGLMKKIHFKSCP